MTGLLDTSELQKYHTGGFLAVREFLAGNDLSQLLENVNRFIRDTVPNMPAEHVFYEDKSDAQTLKQIQNIGERDLWFHDLLYGGRLRKLAEQLLNGPVVPQNLQYFSKPAGRSRATPPHQDGYYFMLDPCEAITMWLGLDPIDEDNGCVRYVRGSHLQGMREHVRTQTLGFSQGIVDYPTANDSNNEIALPTNPGDLLVHDAMTIHRADANSSASRSRRALGFVYYSERARIDAVAHANYQQMLARDMKAQGRI